MRATFFDFFFLMKTTLLLKRLVDYHKRGTKRQSERESEREETAGKTVVDFSPSAARNPVCSMPLLTL